jgi:hypothetical protein
MDRKSVDNVGMGIMGMGLGGYLSDELHKGNFKKGHLGALDIYSRSSPTGSGKHVAKGGKNKSLWSERSREIQDISIEKSTSKDISRDVT